MSTETESNILMHIIKDEPQAEVTEFSVCKETFAKIEGVEPKQEEELNSFFIKHDLQINDDYCGVYDGTLVKHEFNDTHLNHSPFYNATDAITRNESELHLIISRNDGTCQLTTTEAALNHNKISIRSETRNSTKNLNSKLSELNCNLHNVSKQYTNQECKKANVHERGFQKFNCHLCTYATKGERNLLRHMKVCHGSEEYKCDQCNFTTKLKEYLMRHVRDHHCSKEFKCHLCSYATKWKKNLSRHMRTLHGTEEFKCYLCSYATKWKNNLSRHVKVRHGSQEYKCDQCKFTTKLKEYLMRHVKGHHCIKEFKCHLCSFVTKWKKNLLRHLKVHHGSEEYKCDQCKFSTKLKEYLLRHMRAHHPSEKFKCPLCGFATKRTQCLLEHVRAHGSEKFQ